MKFSQLFDRSFSGAWWKQVLWLSGAILIAFTISWLVSLVVLSPSEAQGWKIVQLLIDTGSFSAGGSKDSGNVIQIGGAQYWFYLIVTLLGAVLFSGMLISLVSNILQRRVERYNKGRIFYNYSDHILILGNNRISPAVIRHICDENNDVTIVIATEQDIDSVKNMLSVTLDEKYFKRLWFNHAKRNSMEFLDKLQVYKATCVYVLGEKEEDEHDIKNIETLNFIAEDCSNHKLKKKLPVIVQFNNYSSYVLFQATELNEQVKKHIEFIPYNFNEYWARRIFVPEIRNDIDRLNYKPLDYKPITADSNKYVHLVIFGMTGMGHAVASEAAHIAHFPNFVTKRIRTKITFVDKEASKEMFFFQGRYRELFKLSRWCYRKFENGKEIESESTNYIPEVDFLDVEWEFINSFSSDTVLQNELVKWTNDDNQVLTFVVCDRNPAINTATGFYFPNEVYDAKIPVLVQQPTSNSIGKLISSSSKFSEIKPFGMFSNSYSNMYETLQTMGIAINYVYKIGDFEKLHDRLPIDEAGKYWDECTVSIKWSNIYNAITYWTKNRYFSDADTDNSKMLIAAEVEHTRWSVEKLMLGFRPVTKAEFDAIKCDISLKNKYKKCFAHYDLRPFNELCPDEKGVNVSRNDILMIKSIQWVLKQK